MKGEVTSAGYKADSLVLTTSGGQNLEIKLTDGRVKIFEGSEAVTDLSKNEFEYLTGIDLVNKKYLDDDDGDDDDEEDDEDDDDDNDDEFASKKRYHCEIGMDVAMTLDSRGRPHIAYVDGRYGSLVYNYRDNNKWSVMKVDSGRIDGDCSIVVDSEGIPHITYTREEGDKLALKHAYLK